MVSAPGKSSADDPWSGVRSQSAFPHLTGPDSHHVSNIRHEDLPIPDGAGLRGTRNGFDHFRRLIIRDIHFES